MPELEAQNPPRKHIANILLVDDREDDVLFFRRAFRSADLHHTITHLRDGDEAIKYLSRQAPYNDPALHPVPDVVVLDLKMPKKDGFEVLQWLREQNELKPAPVVILTSSDRDDDKKRAKELGAGSYYTKPVDFTKLVGVAKDITRRWLKRRRDLWLLIVDDDENDRFLLEQAFLKLNVGYRIQPLKNGTEAVALIKPELRSGNGVVLEKEFDNKDLCKTFLLSTLTKPPRHRLARSLAGPSLFWTRRPRPSLRLAGWQASSNFLDALATWSKYKEHSRLLSRAPTTPFRWLTL